MRIQPEDSHINDIKENVKVIFWNVAGIMNKGNDFWTFIEKFDVVNLLETWVEENTWRKIKGKLPRNWNWKCTFATRTCKKGRAKGGIITGIKKLFKEQEGGINTENIQERKLIIDESKWRIIAVYNPEGGEGVWQDLKHKLEDYEEENLLIGGDFNCRTGILGTWKDGEDMWIQRNSKDKTVNKQGRYLIKEIEDRGWYILNGAIKGDEEGNFTYIGERGETVIDYVIVNEFSKEWVEKMTVEPMTFSDHLPLCIETSCEKTEIRSHQKKLARIQIWTDDAIKKYQERTEKEKFSETVNVNEIWKELEKAVSKSIETKEVKIGQHGITKQKWWDRDCREKRREVNKKLRYAQKGVVDMGEYKICRKEYKKLCITKKNKEKEDFLLEIKQIRKEADVWKHVKKLKGNKNQLSDDISMDKWREHFIKLLQGSEERQHAKISRRIEEVKLTDSEIETQIKNLKKEKAAGEEGIKNEAWIHSKGRIREKLKELIKLVWRGEGFPEAWRVSIIYPIWKKGSRDEAENYRGVSLLSTAYKVYASILNEKIKTEVENFLPESQAGFRTGRGTLDNIYILNIIADKKLKTPGGKLVAFFADFSAAFDTIDRDILWKVLLRNGVSDGNVSRCQEIYSETINKVGYGRNRSEQFWTSKGVRQGCPLSPILFAAYIAELDRKLSRAQAGGVVIGNKKVHTLAYADDLVLLAEDDGQM